MARSPNYPTITPVEAVTDAKNIWGRHQRATMTPEEMTHVLGYKGINGASRSRLAALKKYGILEKRGKGLTLSDRAIAIAVRAEDSAQYKQAVVDAIRDVELFSMLFTQHGESSERMVKEHLITELAFTTDGAERAASAFFAAKKLLKDLEAEPVESNGSGDAGGDGEEPKLVRLGDLIQWESQGVAQFLEPKEVKGISEDGDYVFVDGTASGIPMSQVLVETPTASLSPKTPPPNPFAQGGDTGGGPPKPKVGVKQATLPLDSGLVLVEWPDSLTPDDYEDIKEWLKILERKIGRSAEPDEDD